MTPYLRMEAHLFRMAQNGCPTWAFIFPSAPRYRQAQYHQGACILRNSIDVPFPMAHRYRFVYYRTVISTLMITYDFATLHPLTFIGGWMQLTSMEVHLASHSHFQYAYHYFTSLPRSQYKTLWHPTKTLLPHYTLLQVNSWTFMS